MTESKMGRPSKFNEALSEFIYYLASEGKTDEQICGIVGIAARTLYYWKNDNPDFMQLLKKKKDIADKLVEASLFQRACGYSHPEEKIFVRPNGGNKALFEAAEDLARELGVGKEKIIESIYKSGHTKTEDVIRAETTKHYPPSEVACFFWLKNRKPDEWADKPEVGVTGEIKIVIDSDDEKL